MLFFTKFMVDEIFFFIEGKRAITIGFLHCIRGKSMARQGKQVLGEQAAQQRQVSILYFGRLQHTDTIINYCELFNTFSE